MVFKGLDSLQTLIRSLDRSSACAALRARAVEAPLMMDHSSPLLVGQVMTDICKKHVIMDFEIRNREDLQEMVISSPGSISRIALT